MKTKGFWYSVSCVWEYRREFPKNFIKGFRQGMREQLEYVQALFDLFGLGLDRVARGEPFRYVKAHKKHIQDHNGKFLSRDAKCDNYCHCETCILGLGK